MNNREKLWKHFTESGNPMSYMAYRQQAKKDDVTPLDFDNALVNENL